METFIKEELKLLSYFDHKMLPKHNICTIYNDDRLTDEARDFQYSKINLLCIV